MENLTFEELNNIIEKYNIPKNVVLMSDSEWECDPTDMLGIYYNEKENIIMFTQYFSDSETYYTDKNGWKKLYSDSLIQNIEELIK